MRRTSFRILIAAGFAVAGLTTLSSCGTARQARVPVDSNEEEELNIGYGTVTRKNNTYAVEKLKVDRNEINSYNNIFDYLRGRVAGVVVSGPANGLGQPSVTIRGINSINSSTEPLYVVDGITVDNIMWVNPNDVYSVEVLKDSAASIYGVRGANGVIVITTKTGRTEIEAEEARAREAREAKRAERKKGKNKPKVSVNASYGVTTR